MSDTHETEHGSTSVVSEAHAPAGHTAETSGFSPAEVSALHEDDRVAAGHIVKLMVAIFLVGIVIYSIVALVCSRGS